MEFLVRMIRLLLEGVVNSKTKEKKKKRTEILQTGNVQSSPRMVFFFAAELDCARMIMK